MIYWLLGTLLFDVVVLLTCFPLQTKYLKHIRHYHRGIWEGINRQASRRWRYFKGIPSTGLLISTFIGDAEYKARESGGFLWVGRLIVFLNLLHVLTLGAIVVLSVIVFVF